MFEENLQFNIQKINDPLFTEKQVSVYIARLDLLNEVVSGNKLFKLHFFIQKAQQEKKTIITFGGAFSNHLVATAFHCKKKGIESYGIVRGEEPSQYSQTLLDCLAYGMKIKFISRIDYDKKEELNICKKLHLPVETSVVIPEGGYHPQGALGASLIMKSLNDVDFTHICLAVGTATTLAGILQKTEKNKKVIAVPVIKNMTDIATRIDFLLQNNRSPMPIIFDEYHFGGYANKNNALLQFMNHFYALHKIPSDFIYTGKLFYGIMDKIKNNYFEKNSKIICIHTGGIQGNRSLPAGSLIF